MKLKKETEDELKVSDTVLNLAQIAVRWNRMSKCDKFAREE